ncbi:MAG: hypothetical protein ACE366_22665 [Bradymonadia bacterium]
MRACIIGALALGVLGCQPPEEIPAVAGTWQVQQYTITPEGACDGTPTTIPDPSSCIDCLVPASTFVMGPQQAGGGTVQVVFPCDGAEACASIDPADPEILSQSEVVVLNTVSGTNWRQLTQTSALEATAGSNVIVCRYREVDIVLQVEGEEADSARLSRTERESVAVIEDTDLTVDGVANCLGAVNNPPSGAAVVCVQTEEITASLVVEEESE